jgi:large subunit ribosomal protein L15
MSEIRIIAPKGAKKNRKILGRGNSSGYGSTSGKGHKGQKARSGGGVRPGFEGGQMPLYRRIARRGFSNARFKKVYTIVKLGDLEIFEDGTKITKKELLQNKIIRKKGLPVKILSGGELTKKLTIIVDKISKNALQKIESLGGQVTVLQQTEKDNEETKENVQKKETPKKAKKAKDEDKVGEDGK